VRDCDATLILVRGALRGGSAYTRDEAERMGKPCLMVDLDAPRQEALDVARKWLVAIPGSRLNVAGPRASEQPGIHSLARDWLSGLLRSLG
jgi:hypothetical protein